MVCVCNEREQSFSKGIESKDVETLRQCLRTYAMIDKIDIVENIFRNSVVVPFVAKHVNKESVKGNEIEHVYTSILDFIKSKCHTLNQATLDTVRVLFSIIYSL